MIARKSLFALGLSTLALAACAPHPRSAAGLGTAPEWAFAHSDVPLDRGFRFGALPNGMRYAIRHNATPKGTAMVRMQIDAGSLDEAESERGYAHFVEHMAFEGSTHVPEGEMVKLLEREGLAFGADTNAQTTYERTTYMLDLPRTDPALLDTALKLMRETVSELSFTPGAVNRERGVVLAEMRDRGGFALRNYTDQVGFMAPKSRFVARLPIGTTTALNSASAEALKEFWAREYVPAKVTLIVIGDFDEAAIEAAIKGHFADWTRPPSARQPSPGPVDRKRRALAELHIDPALSEHVAAFRIGKWLDEPDTLAQRRENVLRQIGYAIVNRRLLRRTREAGAPFRNAGLSTEDLFRVGRITQLGVDTVDGKWRRGLIVAAQEYRRALQYGFSAEEITEQLAEIRRAHAEGAASEATRGNAALTGAVLALLNDRTVPDTPTNSRDRLEAFIPEITPAAVQAALARELVPLDAPLLRFQGRADPAGGADGLRQAWDEAMRGPVTPPEAHAAGTFGYTDFGPPGTVVSDTREPKLGIRTLRFANGVRLNLKRTELEQGKLLVQFALDGGGMLATRANPLAVKMAGVLPQGGLGKHSKDELDTLTAGRTVFLGFGADEETFRGVAGTTPADLPLQLQLIAAEITDPGYRKEGEVLFRQNINNQFAALRSSPGAALGADYGAILSDGDPRFSLGKVEDWRALSFDKLHHDIGDRLAKGALELAIVGDIDEDAAIKAVAQTLGALPPREAEFGAYPEQRTRPFTADRHLRVLHHSGPKDQALLTVTWPTRDGEDPAAALSLQLLDRVVQLVLTDTLREKLGKAYSPGASTNSSRVWRGYGTFGLQASLDVGDLAASRAAIRAALAELRAHPVSADLLLRARAPLLETYANALKGNGGWLALATRAQSQSDRIDRFTRAPERLNAITAAQLQALAQRYLTDAAGLEIDVLPDGVEGN